MGTLRSPIEKGESDSQRKELRESSFGQEPRKKTKRKELHLNDEKRPESSKAKVFTVIVSPSTSSLLFGAAPLKPGEKINWERSSSGRTSSGVRPPKG